MNKKTSIIIVAWNHERFLADCVRAVEQSGISPDSARLIIVNNNSNDNTAEVVRGLLSEDESATKNGFPAVFFDSPKNLGFAGGNNWAIQKAIAEGDEYVYLLNPDTEVTPGFLDEAIKVAERGSSVGIVQSQLRLHPRKELLNSYGNEIHFLGFGYTGGESLRVDDPRAAEKLAVRDIASASGAGMLIKVSVLKRVGHLDEEFFAYHEDLEFSWRVRLAGYRILLAPESVVYHKYEFSRSIQKYYYMERNRWLVVFRCYRLATLILLTPACLVMELGIWFFALKSGWWKEKGRAYGYFLLPSTWLKLARSRKRIRRLRTVSDRRATQLFTGKILFQQMQPFLLTRVANPLFSLYWKIAHFLMFW